MFCPTAAEMTSQRMPLVLVADDNQDAADSLAIALSFFGCEAVAVYDADDCLSMASALQPDVIVLDLHMPSMSGLDAALQLRLLPHQSHLIAVTGDASVEAAQRVKEVGFVAHWVKPIDPDKLANQIRELTELTAVAPSGAALHLWQEGLPSSSDLAGA